MTYKELLEKNARIRAQRAAAKELLKAEVKPAPIVEETPHVCEYTEPVIEETVKVEKGEEIKEEVVAIVEGEEAPKKKRKSSKPKNREYMVVENIEEVNKDE